MGKEVLIKGLNFSKTVATRRAASRLLVTMGGHSRMGGKTHAEGGSGGGIFARNREDPAPTVGMAGRSLRGSPDRHSTPSGDTIACALPTNLRESL